MARERSANIAGTLVTETLNVATLNVTTIVLSSGQDVSTTANDAYIQANAARDQANTAYTQANSARDQANTARSDANTTFSTINSTFGTVNTAVTNSYNQANAAYAEANLKLNITGGTINGSLNVSGNLTITGNTKYVNVDTYIVTDPLIYLAANNDTSDIVDIGFMGGHNTAGVYQHSGLARDAGDGTWYLFTGLADEGHENNVVDFANTTLATLRANINADSTITNELNVTNNLVVTGNVGIGTSNITSKLTVNGNINLDANARFGLLAENDIFTATNGVNTAQYGITFSPDLLGISGYFGLGLYTSGSERIRVSGNGNVGIATTSPISTLHSNGAFTVTKTAAYNNTENYNFRFSDSANTNKTLWGGYDTSLDGGFIQSTFTGVEHKPLFVNPNGGNVSIGTTTTTARLSLAITANNYMVDLINASEGAFALRTYNHGTSVGDGVSFSTGLFYNTEENASIKFHRGGSSTGGFLSFSTNNGSEKLRITSAGFVGIGTSSPTRALHVFGTGPILGLNSTSTGSTSYIAFQNSGANDSYIGIENSSGTGLFGSNDAYGMSLGTIGARAINFATNNIVRGRFTSGGYLAFSATSIGNLSSGNIASLEGVGIKRYSFSIQADNVWRTLVSNFNDRVGMFFVTLSDTASGDVAAYSFRTTSPAYGVTALNQIFYHDGGWNTGTFEFRMISTGSLYQLEARYSSYYSSSNIGYADIYFWMLSS